MADPTPSIDIPALRALWSEFDAALREYNAWATDSNDRRSGEVLQARRDRARDALLDGAIPSYPSLLDEVERLRAEVAWLRAGVAWRDGGGSSAAVVVARDRFTALGGKP